MNEVERLLADLGTGTVEADRLQFSSDLSGWSATGLVLSSGAEVTVFIEGRVEGFERPVKPSDLLWARVGEGDVFALTGDGSTFTATTSGILSVATVAPGTRWHDCAGTLPSEAAIDPDHVVEIDLLVAAWRTSAESGLFDVEHPAAKAALATLESTPNLPRGFQPLCHLRPAPVFSAWSDSERQGVHGHARGNAGIIKMALDLPLDDSSRIDFAWLYRTLPALGPETDPRTHDYSSIAIEFDNGQDITWMWGTHVPAGTSFHCPLRWWDERETHIVLQSGTEGLGRWYNHSRPIAEDYDDAVGGERPKRIVGLWFISVGAFGGGLADATFADVTVRSGDREIRIFGDAEVEH